MKGYWKIIVSCFLRAEPLHKYQTTGLTWDKEHCSLQVEPRGAGTRCSWRGKMWTVPLPQWYLRQRLHKYPQLSEYSVLSIKMATWYVYILVPVQVRDCHRYFYLIYLLWLENHSALQKLIHVNETSSVKSLLRKLIKFCEKSWRQPSFVVSPPVYRFSVNFTLHLLTSPDQWSLVQFSHSDFSP